MLHAINRLYPVRYTVFGLCVAALLACLMALVLGLLLGQAVGWPLLGVLAFGGLSALGVRDLTQTFSAVRRNYPIIGHIRFALEKIRPEIRQYFIESDTEATPFSRSQRSLVYARAKIGRAHV